MDISTRLAQIKDVQDITSIYNQGIEDRIATLETRTRGQDEMGKWLTERADRYKVIVATEENDKVVGWASLNVFNKRACYKGVADLSVYVERQGRGKRIGKILMKALMDIAITEGFYKVVLVTFTNNSSAQALYESSGFRRVGTYMKHGRLDGNWIDLIIMERILV